MVNAVVALGSVLEASSDVSKASVDREGPTLAVRDVSTVVLPFTSPVNTIT